MSAPTMHGVPIVVRDENLLPTAAQEYSRDDPGEVLEGANPATFYGEHLLALAADDFNDIEVRRSAKRLTRLALAGHLGDSPLRSRELFRRL